MTFARFLMTILTKSVSIIWKRAFSSRNGWRRLRGSWVLFAHSFKVDKESYQMKWRLLYWESSKGFRNGLHMCENLLIFTHHLRINRYATVDAAAAARKCATVTWCNDFEFEFFNLSWPRRLQCESKKVAPLKLHAIFSLRLSIFP